MFIKVLFRTVYDLSKPDAVRQPALSTLPRKVLDKLRRSGYPIAMATPGPKPLELQAHAMDNLRYIRRTLERAGEFTAVPGLGGVLMGSTALAAALIAGPRTASPR